MRAGADMAVTRVAARAYTIPTDAPELDGTIAWDSTTTVTAEVEAGGNGLGYTYCDKSAAALTNTSGARARPTAWGRSHAGRGARPMPEGPPISR